MRWTRVFTLVALLAACTKPNEAKHCTAGTCTTPNFPFCDVSGAFSGEAGTCIAIACEPGTFGECRGDAEVRCNATGDNYEVVQCERGCDLTASGCRLCDPNETACTNGTVATCNAAGAVISQSSCPLGCFEDQPRCRDIAPSNGLAQYLDMVSNAPDLDLSAGGFIETQTGTVTTAAGSMTVPSFLVPAPSGGAAIRVIVGGRVRLGDVGVYPGGATDGPALAILASDEITVEGRLTITDADRPTVGGVAFASCKGQPGIVQTIGAQTIITAYGGGGHATAGSRGGGVDYQQGVPGGAGGAASGTETLVPLRGGCAGGASGGGAVQLSSRKRIEVLGVIDTNGGVSGLPQGPDSLAGGGAGGGILLEAPTITLAPEAKLLANGGSGGSCSANPMQSETTSPSLGGATTSPYCGAGGNGGAVGIEATNGGPASYTASTSVTYFWGGGGAGGLGRVRINTRDSTYTKANTTIEAAALTTGTIATR